MTNVGVCGRWVFEIDRSHINDMFEMGDLDFLFDESHFKSGKGSRKMRGIQVARNIKPDQE